MHWFEQVALIALDKRHTLLNGVVSNMVGCCNELIDDWLEHKWRNQDLRSARVENRVRSSVDCKGLILTLTEAHCLETSRPEKVIIEPNRDTCVLVERSSFNMRQIRVTEVHSR